MEYVLYQEHESRGLKPWEIIAKHKLKWCPRARLTDRIKISFHWISDFLAMLCCLFYAEKKIYFYLKTTKENSQKFIISKRTRQHFTGNILTSHYNKYGLISVVLCCLFVCLFMSMYLYFLILLWCVLVTFIFTNIKKKK